MTVTDAVMTVVYKVVVKMVNARKTDAHKSDMIMVATSARLGLGMCGGSFFFFKANEIGRRGDVNVG
jgi:hypothetical protein